VGTAALSFRVRRKKKKKLFFSSLKGRRGRKGKVRVAWLQAASRGVWRGKRLFSITRKRERGGGENKEKNDG